MILVSITITLSIIIGNKFKDAFGMENAPICSVLNDKKNKEGPKINKIHRIKLSWNILNFNS